MRTHTHAADCMHMVEAAAVRSGSCCPIYPSERWRAQVFWDSGSSVAAYCRRMAQGGVWGGGIEMAAFSELKGCNVEVYEQCSAGFKRISLFEKGGSTRTVRVCYRGGVHYDALELR